MQYDSLLIDDHLNVLKVDGTPDPDVWALGDSATIDGNALPATAQGMLLRSD
jgi:hypothetical protein